MKLVEFLIFCCMIVACNGKGAARRILKDEISGVFLTRTFGCMDLRGGYGDEPDKDKHTKTSRMLRYWLDDEGKRVYTVRKVDPFGRPTYSAYPARFSPRQ
jgi:hypothetical protein